MERPIFQHTERKDNIMENTVTKREKFSYGMYFMGQNVFYGLIGYMTTYFTDVGITAALVAVVALITKVWDAINDPIFGMIMDKVHFKKGKFLPWLRMSVIAIPVSTILLFVIPTGIPLVAKLIWATLAYMLWDTAYTLCDVPIFGIVTTMTLDQKERVSLNSIGRIFAIFAGIVTGILLPLVRQSLGGWATTVIVLSILSAAMMIPMCLFAKERVIEREKARDGGAEENYTLRDMVECLRSNKYLLIFFAAPLINSLLNIGATWGLYIARYCLGGEEIASFVSMAVIVPTLIGAAIAVQLCKKYDKFKIFYFSYMFALILGIVRYIAGYENMMVYVILNALGGFPLGIAAILQYQFTPDCYEYGQYKTGLKMRGVTFAAQTFFTKLNGAIATAVSVFALTLIGFKEGEGVIQAAGFADKLWTFSCLGSIIGGICTLLILHLYKLNDHDVQLMSKCNNGEITREEAEAQMINRY